MKLLAAFLALALGVLGAYFVFSRSARTAFLPDGPPGAAATPPATLSAEPTPPAGAELPPRTLSSDQLSTSWTKSTGANGVWLQHDSRASAMQAAGGANSQNSSAQSQAYSAESDRRDPRRVQRRQENR